MKRVLGRHQDIVAALQSQVYGASHGGARITLLKGTRGMGKTRVIQGLYEELRSRQREPAYWPSLSLTDDEHPLVRRSRYSPAVAQMTWPIDSVPEFAWWGLDCARLRDGTLAHLGDQIGIQLDVHKKPLLYARLQTSPFDTLLNAQKTRLRRMGQDTLREGGASGLEQVLKSMDVALPGLGLIASLTKEVGQGAAEVRKLRREYREEVPVGDRALSERQRIAQDYAQAILHLSSRRVPSVVVVEDLHLMTDETARFIDTLTLGADQEHPVMVVATAWPEGMGNTPFASWFKFSQGTGRIQEVDVPTLGLDDRITLARTTLPDLSDAQSAVVAKQISNPLALELWLNLESTRARVKRGDDLLEDSRTPLATDFFKLVDEAWLELPSSARESLLPVMATIFETGLTRWLPEIVSVVAQALGMDKERFEGGMALAITPAQWVIAEPSTQSISDPLFLDVLQGRVLEQYERAQIEKIQGVLGIPLRAYFEHIWPGRTLDYLPDSVAAIASVAVPWIRAVAADLKGIDEVRVRWAEAQLAATGGAWHTAREIGASVLRLPVVRGDEALSVDLGVQVARWAAADNDIPTCLQQLEELMACATIPFSGTDIRVRVQHARWVTEGVDYGRGVALMEQLLIDATDRLGADHPGLAPIKANLLRWHTEQEGRVSSEQVRDLRRELTPGASTNDRLMLDNELALAQCREGRHAEALSAFQSLYRKASETFGANSPQAWRALGNITACHGHLGDYQEAQGTLDSMRKWSRDWNGEYHADTLHVRSQIATLHLSSGNMAVGVSEHCALLADRRLHLGPTHMDTKRSRRHVEEMAAHFLAINERRLAVPALFSLYEHEVAIGSGITEAAATYLVLAGSAIHHLGGDPDHLRQLQAFVVNHMGVSHPLSAQCDAWFSET